MHVFVFDSSFEHIVRKLEILVESGEREKALEIEKEIPCYYKL